MNELSGHRFTHVLCFTLAMLFLQIPHYEGILAGLTVPIFEALSFVFVPSEGFNDFDCCYYRAGQLIMTDPALLYVNSEYRGGEFVNIPIVAWLFAPLATIPLKDAGRIWMWISLIAACACLYLLQLRASGLDNRIRWVITLAFIFSGPVVRTLNLGQSTIVVLLLLMLAENCYWRKWFGRAGLFLGLACLIKMPPLLLLPYLALRRQWRVLLMGCAVGILAVTLSIALHGWQLHVEYLDAAILSVAGKSLAAYNNQSLNAGIVRVFTDLPLNPWAYGLVPSEALIVAPSSVRVLVYTATFILLLVVVSTVMGASQSRYTERLVEIGLVMNFALLVLPVYWIHYGVWLLPLAVGVGSLLRDLATQHSRRLAFGLLVISVLLINIPISPTHVIEQFETSLWFRVVISHQMAGTLLLFGLCAWALRISSSRKATY